MYTNTDMTLYHQGDTGYSRHLIKGVFWDDTFSENTSKTGQTAAAVAKVYVPLAAAGQLNIRAGDIAIKGDCSVEFDNTSEETVSQTLKALKKSYEVYMISECAPKLYGSQAMQHYELVCK